ncbi:terminase large subunit domain-containing protein [Qipengyuania sp. SS22]|uniref:terminase large subunit domain-containing protein n=1 Tax=Qipengyuania sp. SS22 TaxID=2979461 RepID=UPI0029665893|nr:terminase family protein [Qipengyuania sp. SS22]
MLGDGFLDWLRKQNDCTKTGLIAQLEERERALIRHDWPLWRREAQSPPRGAWNCWVICAGRGFGKTRTGAEWVRESAILDPDARIALVAASLGEARSVMVEGESGVLAICPPNYRPFYEPSLKRLTWPNGAMAFLYSAAEPESLRGPQHSHACGPGAERTFRQRGVFADRCAAPSGRRGCGQRATSLPRRRRELGSRRSGQWRMGGPCA